MTTFGLVHGAWHGAWCWERVAPLLQAAGCDTVAVDLPTSDSTATFQSYADVVVRALSTVTGPVVLVGHSLGALTVPLVAAARPVSTTVLLCGVTPHLRGRPWDDAPPMEDDHRYDRLVREADGTCWWPDVEAATDAMYHSCGREAAAWAFSRLRRQNSLGLWAQDYPLREWPQTRWAAVLCTEDRVILPDFIRHTVRERLGIEPVELPGDHSPFLADPAALAEVLLRWA